MHLVLAANTARLATALGRYLNLNRLAKRWPYTCGAGDTFRLFAIQLLILKGRLEAALRIAINGVVTDKINASVGYQSVPIQASERSL